MPNISTTSDTDYTSVDDLTSSSIQDDEEEEQWVSEPDWSHEQQIKHLDGAESLSSDGKSSDTSDGEDWQDRPSSPDLPADYWQVQKLVKYIKAGNPTATLICLCALRDMDLDDKIIQIAIKESGGLQVLLNMLDTEEDACKQAALIIVRQITQNKHIRRNVFNMRGLDSLVACLSDYSKSLKLMSAETIANLCQIKKARRIMRKSDGISRLVDMLEIEKPAKYYIDPDDAKLGLEVQRCAAIALWSLARSTKNREAIRRAGAVPLLAKLLKTGDDKVVVPVVGVLQECATEPIFRATIYAEGLLEDFVQGLRSPNFDLVQHSAKAIHMCTLDGNAREILFKLGAIDMLISILEDTNFRTNKELVAAGTGAIWKSSSIICRTPKYFGKGLVELLVSFLEGEPQEILINTTGAVEEIIKINPTASAAVRKAGGIPPLVKLLNNIETDLLINTTKTIGILARDTECREEMEAQEAFRFVWSLLKHSSPQVQSSAAYAICPYVRSSKLSAEMVRNFVGGLEVIVELILSPNLLVQAAICEAVAAIATNLENLSIMTDHGIVQYLCAICTRTWENDSLCRSLSKAVAECCKLEGNSRAFGELKAVAPLCGFLTSKEPKVVREATKALSALSEDARNRITIHQCGVVPHLLRLVGSDDDQLHEAAAIVMSNIRHLALTTEEIRLQR